MMQQGFEANIRHAKQSLRKASRESVFRLASVDPLIHKIHYMHYNPIYHLVFSTHNLESEKYVL